MAIWIKLNILLKKRLYNRNGVMALKLKSHLKTKRKGHVN